MPWNNRNDDEKLIRMKISTIHIPYTIYSPRAPNNLYLWEVSVFLRDTEVHAPISIKPRVKEGQLLLHKTPSIAKRLLRHRLRLCQRTANPPRVRVRVRVSPMGASASSSASDQGLFASLTLNWSIKKCLSGRTQIPLLTPQLPPNPLLPPHPSRIESYGKSATFGPAATPPPPPPRRRTAGGSSNSRSSRGSGSCAMSATSISALRRPSMAGTGCLYRRTRRLCRSRRPPGACAPSGGCRLSRTRCLSRSFWGEGSLRCRHRPGRIRGNSLSLHPRASWAGWRERRSMGRIFWLEMARWRELCLARLLEGKLFMFCCELLMIFDAIGLFYVFNYFHLSSALG